MEPVLSAGMAWLHSLSRIAVQGSVLIACVLLLQFLLRRRLSAAWRHALWLFVFVRLALPCSFETGWSIFNWVRVDVPLPRQPESRPSATIAITTPALAIAGAKNDTQNLPQPAGSLAALSARGTLILADPTGQDHGPTSRQRKWLVGLATVWFAGVLALLAHVALESVRLRRSIGPKRLVTDSQTLDLLEDCRHLMGVRTPVVLVQTELVSSPVLYGFIRPRLLLPSGLLAEFSREELRFIFLHELAHVRRHDIALSWLGTALQVLHWFNPLVWIAFARMRADRELACDALVLSRTSPAEHKAYGQTMLRLLDRNIQSRRFPSMAGILENPTELASRIRGIAAFKRARHSTGFAMSLAILLTPVLLTDGRANHVAQSFPTWPGRLMTSQRGSETDVRAITIRPQPGVDLLRAMRRGELWLGADADTTNLLQQGYQLIGAVDGLGLDRWMHGSRAGAPILRTAHSVLWTGQELLVWGGGAQDHFLQSGGRYDPLTDKWRPISTNCPLSGRWHHAAVWTGKEMIVWGGRANFYAKTNRGDGAIYNPATDSWRQMSSNGAPVPRSQMAAVWTGREVLIWGGRGDGETSFSDGARYNPDTDKWTPMSACPELAPRHNATAVWTGRELIVWGGSSRSATESASFDDGARYDPAVDRWILLPRENAPSPRTKHTAVWTGTQMIVWGGVHYPSGNYLDSGGIYDLAANKWQPLPAPSGFSARAGHLAEWVGSSMVVWGGVMTNSECFNTGARFEPATGRWSPLTSENAPAPRFMMRPDSAVWTGRQLLLFGGYDLHSEFNSVHAWTPAPATHLFHRIN